MESITVKDGDFDFESQVTKDEWKQLLSDSQLMSLNYKFALFAFYLEPDHRATCKYLAEKYAISSASISSIVTQFSSAVQKKLNKFELLREDGTQNFWRVTMTGEKVTGGLFEWRLRQELVDAISEMDYVSSNNLYIDSLGTLVKHINQDIDNFKREFAQTRKSLANMGRAPASNFLFKYEDPHRDWAINEGGGTEIQYHIFLRGNEIGYGLGFNAQYVQFKNEKTPVEYIQPFVDVFLSIQDSDEVKSLVHKGFEIDIEYLKNLKDDDYNLFGRTISLTDNQISLIDYYLMLSDLKGDLFSLYKKIFETANQISLVGQKKEVEMIEQDSLVKDICALLEENKNIILTGAPGTGKTYLAQKVIEALDAESEFVQLHPSYDYTDFVEGLRPIQNDNGEVGFELRDGIFKAFCKEAIKYQNNQKLSNFDEVYQSFIDDISESGLELVTPHHKKTFWVSVNSKGGIVATPDTEKQTPLMISKSYIQSYCETNKAVNLKPYLISICNYITDNYDLISSSTTNKNKKFIIILDEINRAEVSKVLGELFYSIDPGYRGIKGRVRTQYANLQTDDDIFNDGFYVPENVYIIGTMNDIDRSVESFDFAMRRRFAWKEIKAEDRLSMWEGSIDLWIDEAKMRLTALNKAIESIHGLNSAYHIGPTYFLKLTNYDGDFEALWIYHLQSLLFEYLRGYPDADEQLANLKNAYNLVNSDDSND